uniref:Uncharacterized protein n=2 Tax=Physcomitrium patens TaxID=3218 RepID=A0A2K1L428_PHYPA|nr:hypothetical protein PHYPA_003581 [Physcomitrium patens]
MKIKYNKFNFMLSKIEKRDYTNIIEDDKRKEYVLNLLIEATINIDCNALISKVSGSSTLEQTYM